MVYLPRKLRRNRMEVALSFTFSVIGGIPAVISIVLREVYFGQWMIIDHPRCQILDFVESMILYGGARIQAPDMGGIRDSRNGYGVINPSCCLASVPTFFQLFL